MAVIELDLDAPPGPRPVRPPVRWYRAAGLALAGLLTFTLGAAAPAGSTSASTRWQHLGTVPLDGADSLFALAGGLIYSVDPGSGSQWRTSAWTGMPLRRAWTVTTGSPGDDRDATGNWRFTVSRAGDHVLLEDTSSSTVVDARTGRVRWSTPGPLQPLGPGVGVVTETSFRPGTEYDVAGGAPGELFFSATGKPHTEPPRSTTLHGVDLATGRRLWSSEWRGAVRAARPPGDRAVLIVAASDRLALLAGDTGAELRSRPLPRSGGVAWVQYAGDLALVRRGPLDGPGVLAAYATDTLAFRWETTDEPVRDDSGFCSELACSRGRSGQMALDPGTGRPVWRVEPGTYVVRRGGFAVEMSSGGEQPVRARDASTGADRVRLSGWDAAVNREGDGPLVLRRAETARGVTAFGALPPGGTRVQPLGTAAALLDDCRADETLVVCRTDAGAEVWAYRA